MKLKHIPILFVILVVAFLLVMTFLVVKSLNPSYARVDQGALSDYSLLMANRENNKIIDVTPDKSIVGKDSVTVKKDVAKGSLNTPSGVDIIEHPDRVGAISRHPAGFIGKPVFIQGYVLKKENGYVIFSDEPTGALGIHDLPVVGAGTDSMVMNQKYMLRGTFTNHGLLASNGSIYHLDLSELPKKATEQ